MARVLNGPVGGPGVHDTLAVIAAAVGGGRRASQTPALHTVMQQHFRCEGKRCPDLPVLAPGARTLEPPSVLSAAVSPSARACRARQRAGLATAAGCICALLLHCRRPVDCHRLPPAAVLQRRWLRCAPARGCWHGLCGSAEACARAARCRPRLPSHAADWSGVPCHRQNLVTCTSMPAPRAGSIDRFCDQARRWRLRIGHESGRLRCEVRRRATEHQRCRGCRLRQRLQTLKRLFRRTASGNLCGRIGTWRARPRVCRDSIAFR